jgi:hypothetical protein
LPHEQNERADAQHARINARGEERVRTRSRTVALLAATGMVAGILALGSGSAQAQDTILLDCDRVAGTASIKPSLGAAAQVTSISYKGRSLETPTRSSRSRPPGTAPASWRPLAMGEAPTMRAT